jgi:hypothetical protein
VTDVGIHFQFSRVIERGEDIYGMLQIATLGFPGHADGVIFDDRIILTGERSKPACAKTCARRIPEWPSWPDLIDDACRLVRRNLALGEPFVDLAEGDVEPVPPWLIEPFMRQDEHALLFGTGGTGKSTVALALMACLSVGVSRWGFTVGEIAKVGYVDFEDSEDNLRRRLEALRQGLELPTRPSVFYKRGESSLAACAESLGRQCAERDIEGLVIDSAGMACGAEPEAADSANGYFRALRGLPIRWSLTIAHQPKDKERSMMPFGSVFWWNNPRMIWKATAMSKEGSDHLDIGLIHRKANNGRFEKSIGLHLVYRDGSVTINKSEASIPIEAQTNGLRILEVLADGSELTAIEIERRSGVKHGSVGVELGRLKKNLQIKQDGLKYSAVIPGFLEPPERREGFYGTEAIDDIPFG